MYIRLVIEEVARNCRITQTQRLFERSLFKIICHIKRCASLMEKPDSFEVIFDSKIVKRRLADACAGVHQRRFGIQ